MKPSSLLALFVALAAAMASPAFAQYRPQPSQPVPTAPAPPASSPSAAAEPAPAATAAAPAPAAAPATSAQAATSNSDAEPAAPTYPSPNCTIPTYPGKSGTDEQRLAFNRGFKDYDNCVRKYVEEARAFSRAAVDAGNKAVADYNKYTEEIKKQIAADQGGTEKQGAEKKSK